MDINVAESPFISVLLLEHMLVPVIFMAHIVVKSLTCIQINLSHLLNVVTSCLINVIKFGKRSLDSEIHTYECLDGYLCMYMSKEYLDL